MCTSITLPLPEGGQLFGRTLDWHEHFDEQLLHTPAGYAFAVGSYAHEGTDARMPRDSRYAILGMGSRAERYPLYADGMNACGLCMAGLRFAASAHYMPVAAVPPEGVVCLAPWELIPYILGYCATLEEAREALRQVRLVDQPFPLASGEGIPTTPLHWHIADGKQGGSLVVEATARGLEVYDAPLGVMTNDPPYPEQTVAYERHLREGDAVPTGYDTTARFIRAASLVSDNVDIAPFDPVSRFFDIAAQVSPPAGEIPAVSGSGWQTTLYTCCMDGMRGRYIYTTAEDGGGREASV